MFKKWLASSREAEWLLYLQINQPKNYYNFQRNQEAVLKTACMYLWVAEYWWPQTMMTPQVWVRPNWRRHLCRQGHLQWLTIRAKRPLSRGQLITIRYSNREFNYQRHGFKHVILGILLNWLHYLNLSSKRKLGLIQWLLNSRPLRLKERLFYGKRN